MPLEKKTEIPVWFGLARILLIELVEDSAATPMDKSFVPISFNKGGRQNI